MAWTAQCTVKSVGDSVVLETTQVAGTDDDANVTGETWTLTVEGWQTHLTPGAEITITGNC